MTNTQTTSYTKDRVEGIPFGDLSVSVQNAHHNIWREQGRIEWLSNAIIASIQKAENLGIAGCLILRLVIVTGDFKNETTKWTKELDETWKISSDGAIGQTLVWGNGQPNTTYSIIILSEEIALDLIISSLEVEISEAKGEIERKSYGKGTLIHELAHVHDYFRYLLNIGNEPVIRQGDWISIRQFIARSTWGEFFSESVAYPYLPDINVDESISYGSDLLQKIMFEVDRELLNFKTHQDAHKIWAFAVERFSTLFNHFGRCLGLLISIQQKNENKKPAGRFFKEIYDISQDWGEVVHSLFNELTNMDQDFDVSRFNNLGRIIDQGFRVVGLDPYRQG